MRVITAFEMRGNYGIRNEGNYGIIYEFKLWY